MDITIKTIPHSEQRYETVGDWWFADDHNLQIRVSHMGEARWHYEAAIAFHELAEALLCKSRGITTAMVDEFDQRWLEQHPGEQNVEPGDDPECAYRAEHFFATTVERMLINEFDLDWQSYEDVVITLWNKGDKNEADQSDPA